MPLPATYYRYTALYNWAASDRPSTGRSRVGGWSESWCHQTGFPANNANFLTLCNLRLAAMPPQISFVGLRIADLKNPGAGTFASEATFGGGLADTTDIPQMSLLLTGRGDVGNKMKMTLRGLPDGQVVGGVLKLAGGYSAAIKLFTDYVGGTNGWGQPVRDLAAVTSDIIEISAPGAVFTAEPVVGIAEGNKVQILRSIAGGKRFGGTFFVGTVRTSQDFDLIGWKGVATKGGKIRFKGFRECKYVKDSMIIRGAVTRKIGAPFFKYVGKSKRTV